MSILSGPEIDRLIERTRLNLPSPVPSIDVRPLLKPAGPNSLDVRLGRELRVYALYSSPYARLCDPSQLRDHLSTRHSTPTIDLPFTDTGIILLPNVLYLGCTFEWIDCQGLVPWIDGRSSAGRLSIEVHRTAGRGDDGWSGRLTLEISVLHPVEVFPLDVLGQLTFFTIEGERRKYQGRYLGDEGPVASRLHEKEGGGNV